jgi:hypothetical protein
MEPGSIEGICAGRRSFASASLAAKLALMQVLSRPTNRKAAAGLRSQLRHFPQYTGDVRRALARVRLKPLIRKTQPYAKKIAHRGTWVEPSLLAEIEYRAKSAEGRVRHPFFKGLPEDL